MGYIFFSCYFRNIIYVINVKASIMLLFVGKIRVWNTFYWWWIVGRIHLFIWQERSQAKNLTNKLHHSYSKSCSWKGNSNISARNGTIKVQRETEHEEIPSLNLLTQVSWKMGGNLQPRQQVFLSPKIITTYHHKAVFWMKSIWASVRYARIFPLNASFGFYLCIFFKNGKKLLSSFP